MKFPKTLAICRKVCYNKKRCQNRKGEANMEEPVRGSDLPSVSALAYLGDAVHSLDMRRRAVLSGLSRAEDLHGFVTGYVNAAAQSRMAAALLPRLTEEERALFRRASNYRHLQRPKHMSIADYRRATGFEALLGMLSHLGRTERLAELLEAAYQSEKEDRTSDTEN